MSFSFSFSRRAKKSTWAEFAEQAKLRSGLPENQLIEVMERYEHLFPSEKRGGFGRQMLDTVVTAHEGLLLPLAVARADAEAGRTGASPVGDEQYFSALYEARSSACNFFESEYLKAHSSDVASDLKQHVLQTWAAVDGQDEYEFEPGELPSFLEEQLREVRERKAAEWLEYKRSKMAQALVLESGMTIDEAKAEVERREAAGDTQLRVDASMETPIRIAYKNANLSDVAEDLAEVEDDYTTPQQRSHSL